MKTRWNKRPACKRKSGVTLVEVLLSMLILSLIVVAGGAYLYHSGTVIMYQRHKKIALHAANGRLEHVRAARYDLIKPPVLDYTAYYLSWQGTNWLHSTTDPQEQIDVDGDPVSMVTTVEYADLDGGLTSYDYVQLTVRARYHQSLEDEIVLETYVSP